MVRKCPYVTPYLASPNMSAGTLYCIILRSTSTVCQAIDGPKILTVIPQVVRYPLFHPTYGLPIYDTHLWGVNGSIIRRLAPYIPFSAMTQLSISFSVSTSFMQIMIQKLSK